MVIRQDYIAATAFTLLLHVSVMVAVLAGWQLSDSARYRVPTPRYVSATLVTLAPSQAHGVQAPARSPPAPVVTARQQPAAASAASQPIARQSVPKPAAAQPVVATQAEEAPAQPKAEPEPKVEPKPEPVPTLSSPPASVANSAELTDSNASVLATSAAAAKPSRATAEQVQQQQDDLLQALAEEESLMSAGDDATTVASYAGLIKQRVEGGWSRPPSARKNMQVVLAIRMIPTGDVVGVEVVTSSGNAAFDRSAVAAVQRVQRFPELGQVPSRVFDTYFRTFTLVFKPEDLLL